MKGFGLSSTGSMTQPRPSRRSAGALHPGTADELVLVPPRQTLNVIAGNVEHQLDEGFRVVEHPLDDTAPPKSRRSAGVLHPGTADELVLVPPRQTLNVIAGNVEHQLDEGFRVVEHPLDDTAPPKSRRSAGVLHPGTADELVLVPPRQTLNVIAGNVEHQLDEGFRVVEHRLDDTVPPKVEA